MELEMMDRLSFNPLAALGGVAVLAWFVNIIFLFVALVIVVRASFVRFRAATSTTLWVVRSSLILNCIALVGASVMSTDIILDLIKHPSDALPSAALFLAGLFLPCISGILLWRTYLRITTVYDPMSVTEASSEESNTNP